MSMEELETPAMYDKIPNLNIGFIEMIHLTRRINKDICKVYAKNKAVKK